MNRLLTWPKEEPTPTFSPTFVHPGTTELMAPPRSLVWDSVLLPAISRAWRLANPSRPPFSASGPSPAPPRSELITEIEAVAGAGQSRQADTVPAINAATRRRVDLGRCAGVGRVLVVGG